MLTVEQQQIILDSLWVVNTALKAQGLSHDEDMRQSAILHMCKCLERYDESRGVKWTTYAFKSVYYYIKKVNAKEVYRQSCLVDLETAPEVGVDFDGYNIVDEVYDRVEDKYGEKCAMVLTMRINKVPINKISEALDLPKRKVLDYIENIKHEILQING